MDCSSTLTDAELEYMSVRQTRRYDRWSNQWVSIERTQHKCKKCARFFFNEAAFKHYNCESSIRKKKHLHCGKGINCTDNLEKHLENEVERSAHGWCSYKTHWPLEGTWISRSRLTVHGSYLQEDNQQQQQKRRSAKFERRCPYHEIRRRGADSS